MPAEEQIRELAYQIWEKEGRPYGKDWEHYFAARRILEERADFAVHMSEDIGAEALTR